MPFGALTSLVGTVLAVLSPMAVADEFRTPNLVVLDELVLPAEVARASDVRWLVDGQLLLSVSGQGLYSWHLGEKDAPLVSTLAGTGFLSLGRYQDYSRLGVAKTGEVSFAGRFFGVYRHSVDGTARLRNLEVVEDVDRQGDRTAALGLMRLDEGDGDGLWEDYVAWLIRDEGQVRGLLPTRDSGAGLDACSFAELGLLRFLGKGGLLVIPGAEPGVFVYGEDEVLVDSLNAATFLADEGCSVERERVALLSQPEMTQVWLARRRLIDEVVVDGDDSVYFFVRHVPEPPREPILESGPELAGRGDIVRANSIVFADGVTGAVRGRFDGLQVDELLAKLSVEGTLKEGSLVDGAPVGLRDPEVGLSDAIDSGAAPERWPSIEGRVCWDLVHAPLDDLEAVSVSQCAIESDHLDVRLRADVRADRGVVLLRRGTGLGTRASRAFEVRLEPPSDRPSG